MRTVRDDEDTNLPIAQREARDVGRQIDQAGANSLRLEKFAHAWQRGVSEAKTTAICFSEALSLLDRLPARLRSRKGIRGDCGEIAIDADQALEIRQLPSEHHALAELVEDLRLADYVGLRAEQRGKGILLVEGVGDELADVATEQVRELVELQARH